MGRKGRERFEKRQREQVRKEKAAAKAERKQASAEAPDEADADAPDEQALLESFRLLSERHEAGDITDEEMAEQRKEIFERLGIPAD